MRFIKVLVWLFATATSFLFCMALLIGGLLSPSSQGPPAPLSGAISGIAMLAWLFSAVIFVALFIFRPKAAFNTQRIAISGFLYCVFTASLYGAAAYSVKSHSQKLSLELLDTSGHPIKSAILSYGHSLQGDGFRFLSPPKTGTTKTDDAGKAVIDTNWTHETHIEVTHPDFTPVIISFDRDWGFSRQQGGISWLNPEKDFPLGSATTTQDHRGYFGYIPSKSNVSLSFWIPRKSLDEDPRAPSGDWNKAE